VNVSTIVVVGITRLPYLEFSQKFDSTANAVGSCSAAGASEAEERFFVSDAALTAVSFSFVSWLC